jgi:predicted ATP-dependent protease
MRAHLVTEVVENCVDEQSFDMRLDRLQKSMMEEAYLPNVFVSAALDCDAVDAEPTPGAPVIYEANPTHRNLMGHIDYISEQGVLVTNHQHLFAGALHKANGGYLILDAEKLLTDANAWNALKRALKSHQIGVESLAVEQSLVTTPSMSPQLLPLAVKIILIGARDIYYLLQQFDNDFPEMFRVLVDFDEFITRDESTVLEFARVLQCHCHTLGLPVLHQGAVDALLDYSSRLVEHQRRLSARFRLVFELLDEAALCCRQQAAKVITREHISEALRSREQRNNRISQRLLEEMLSGTLVVRSDGEAIGELNGLTVMDLAEHRIGAPARISATAYPGSRGVIDIEREVALGQAVHSKGVMLLTGYLGNAYAVDVPLCLSAHIAMEQSYGYIDGDSASMAEACCLLSAIARIPLRQSLAVTGSLNQHGEVQAVGGVNEKIEGYFALCQRRGLDGQQGVIIPASNISNLVLAEPVLAAVDQGLFHIYAVSTINQALALLVNQEVGEADAEGHYPEQSFNHMVVAQLQAWWHKAQIKL